METKCLLLYLRVSPGLSVGSSIPVVPGLGPNLWTVRRWSEGETWWSYVTETHQSRECVPQYRDGRLDVGTWHRVYRLDVGCVTSGMGVVLSLGVVLNLVVESLHGSRRWGKGLKWHLGLRSTFSYTILGITSLYVSGHLRVSALPNQDGPLGSFRRPRK